MTTPATFASFEKTLQELVTRFAAGEIGFLQPSYDEAKLRQDFLDPLFFALGWDLGNRRGLIQQHREVEIESRTMIAGRRKRADYLFRADTRDRFVCEAKKPAEVLDAKYAFQAKRYAWNKDLALAVLSDFEEFKIYIVGGKPTAHDDVSWGLRSSWHFRDYPKHARELWDLLSRDAVASGSIDRLLDSLPKKTAAKGRARQLTFFKPDRTRALDAEFLNFLDEARRTLGSDLLAENDDPALREATHLNEAVQHILDRLLFLRICEDRDIDIGTNLRLEVENWRSAHPDAAPPRRQPMQPDLLSEEPPTAPWHGGRGLRAPRGSLWHRLVRHFRALDRRPPGTVPFFNGNLFKPHFSEELAVGDVWLAGFLDDIGDDESPYLFNVISVEILGTIYERFLGKVIRPQGRGVTIEEKPEVRKAGGVYYTPRYIVDYIVEQTVGKLLAGQPPEKTLALRLLDPACGSGSFLIRVFERVCEHWQISLTRALPPRERKGERAAWAKKNRALCWVDEATGDIHLTASLKRRILTANIYGVDLDPGAVEVTQLSLYLKMLENENRNTLARERELFAGEDEPALLPPLQDNIKCGNSLIASDFSLVADDLVRVRAFDWPVQFDAIMRAGGFDAVVGNPPYIRIQTMQESDPQAVEYLNTHYVAAAKGNYDIYVVFVERAISLLNSRGRQGFILPHKFFNAQYGEALRKHLTSGRHLTGITHFGHQQVFEGATTYTCLLFTQKSPSNEIRVAKVDDLNLWAEKKVEEVGSISAKKISAADWVFTVGPAFGLLEKLRQQPSTLESSTDRIFQGLKTSADKIYIVEERKRKGRQVLVWSPEKQAEYWLEDGLLHPLVKGGDSRRYSLTKTERLILFPYRTKSDGSVELLPQADLKKQFPKCWEYLCDNKAYLDEREDGRFRGIGWYQFGRSQALDVMPLPKLFTPDLAARASFSFDETGECFFTGGVAGGYGILAKSGVSPKFLLGLLNSKLLNWVVGKTGTQMRGGYFSFEARFIRSLPIAETTETSRHDRLVAHVDKMLALTPKLRAAKTDSERATLVNAIAATDRAIDALVYELYALTPEEIALVEGRA